MNNLLKLEELAMLALGIFLFGLLPYRWWWFPALILVPDISMLGYILSNKAGAFIYNFFHHKGIAIVVYLAGIFLKQPSIQLAGVILFSHSCMDRLFGYGLKYDKGFKFTHLGAIGRK